MKDAISKETLPEKMESTTYLLPEWHPQAGNLITWPHYSTDWSSILDKADLCYTEIARQLSLEQSLHIICFDQTHQNHIQQCLSSRSSHHAGKQLSINEQTISTCNIHFHHCKFNDTWVRDYGPLSATKDHPSTTNTSTHSELTQLLNFSFNGWGNKFPSKLDNTVNQQLSQQQLFSCPLKNLSLVLEGGSIEYDGDGTLLTTSACLMSATRNPGLTQSDIECILKNELGIQQILWLEYGYLSGDDTDSHIDNLARFCSTKTICYTACDNPKDEHFNALKKMTTQLKSFRNSSGKPYKLIALPLPSAKHHDKEGHRLPASYTNFLINNRAVFVPTYQDQNDQKALRLVSECFPDKSVIGIDCTTLIQQHGSLHCATMQLAHGVL